jgi:hypothetical protein
MMMFVSVMGTVGSRIGAAKLLVGDLSRYKCSCSARIASQDHVGRSSSCIPRDMPRPSKLLVKKG